MDIKGIAEAYASMYEAKKKDDEKPKKWHDDDGDGISYEDGEVDGKFPDKDGSKKKKKKKDDEEKIDEEKKKGLDGKACWDGYKLSGTKKKGGKTVDNCVKVNETLLALLDTLEEGADLDIYDTVVAYLIDEELAEDFDSAIKIMGTLQEELIDQVYVQQVKWLVESEKVAQGAMKRAKELAQKRRNKGYREKGYNAYRPGKNERAGYKLSQAARSSDASPETQRTKKKQPAGTDTSQIGHYKKRDEKVTVGKRGKPLKQPKYKLSMGQRVDHHSNKALSRRDPKKNPKHEANK